MFTKPGESGLEILQTQDDEVLASEDGEIKFSVRVFNPGVMKVQFRAGFICPAGFDLVSVETKDSDHTARKSVFSPDHPVVPVRLDGERMLHLADKDFVVWSRQSEQFRLAFRREKPFAPGEVLAFTVRVLIGEENQMQEKLFSFTFD